MIELNSKLLYYFIILSPTLCNWQGRNIVAEGAKGGPPCHSGGYSFYCNKLPDNS